jgi:hypothetical protein
MKFMSHRRKRHKGLHFLVGLILLLTGISITGFGYLNYRNLPLTLQAAALSASNEQLNNPYCGWYQTYDYVISDTTFFDNSSMDKILKEDNNTRLCCLRMDLSAYKDGSISDYGLALVEGILSAWSTSDKEWILRFDYGNSTLAEPADISTIYLHMEQLAPIIDSYQHDIYILQGAFAGKEGNGIDSVIAADTDVTDLEEYLASLTDDTLTLSAYGTGQYYSLMNTSDEETLDRFGIYQEDLSSSLSEDDIARFQTTSLLRPVGGAVGNDSALYDMATALADLKQLHVSYLNAQADATVLEKWKNTTYRSEDVFSGTTFYDYVTTHLGYRYVLTDISLTFDTWTDEKAQLSLTVENTGFANCYRPFDTSVFLRNTETEEMISFPINTDNRLWNPDEDVSLDVSMDVRNYDKGEYTIYFMMMDSSTGEVIHLGNTAPLTSYGYEIGTLIIQ